MNASELKLSALKANKSIHLDNGNEITFVRMVDKGEWRQSVGDNKSRAIVAVNGIECNFPYDIEQIKKFAETGNLLKFRENYIGKTASDIANFDKEHESKKQNNNNTSEKIANKRNLCPISYFSVTSDLAVLECEANKFEEALKIIRDYEYKYNFSVNRGTTGNAICALARYREFKANKLHAKKRWEQYQRAREYKLERLANAVELAKKKLGEYTANHVLELAQQDVLKKVQELGKIANAASERLEREQKRVFLTANDINKMYGI